MLSIPMYLGMMLYYSTKGRLTLSSVKQVLSRALIVMGSEVIRVKLVVLTAIGPPGLGAR